MDDNRFIIAYNATFPGTGKKYWSLRSFQFIIQVIMVFLFIGMLSNLSFNHTLPKIEGYYNSLSFAFYYCFLYCLRSIFRRMAKQGRQEFDEKILKWVYVIKWILLTLTIILIVITTLTVNLAAINVSDKAAMSKLVSIIPMVINKNIAYMIITFLVFYASEVLSVTRRLKEEQSLTI